MFSVLYISKIHHFLTLPYLLHFLQIFSKILGPFLEKYLGRFQNVLAQRH